VRGIPPDKRSKETAAFVGSLVGATMEVDKSTLQRTDYVRIKIAARNVNKVLARAEGAILPYMYDFFYEREMESGSSTPGVVLQVPAGKGPPPSPAKKPRTDEQ
jgi:hypothetical protein